MGRRALFGVLTRYGETASAVGISPGVERTPWGWGVWCIDEDFTTFGVEKNAVGGGWCGLVVIVVGFANLPAGGSGMGASKYLWAKDQHDEVHKTRQDKKAEIVPFPREGRDEIGQIVAKKGVARDLLARLEEAISRCHRAGPGLGPTPAEPRPVRYREQGFQRLEMGLSAEMEQVAAAVVERLI